MASNRVNGNHEADGNLQGSSPCLSNHVSPRSGTLSLENKIQVFKTQVKTFFRSLLTPPLVNDNKNSRITLQECLKMFDKHDESFKTVAGPILIEYLADLITQLIEQNEKRVNYTGTEEARAFEREWLVKLKTLRDTPSQIGNQSFFRQTLLAFSVKFKEFSVEDQHFLREFVIREIVITADALTHTIDTERNKIIAHFHILLEKQHLELQKMANNSNAAIARVGELEQENRALRSSMEELMRNSEREVEEKNLRIEQLTQDLEEKTKEQKNAKTANKFFEEETKEEMEMMEKKVTQLTIENQKLKSQLENGGRLDNDRSAGDITSMERLEAELQKLCLDREQQMQEMNEMRQKIAAQQLTIAEFEKKADGNRDAVENLERKESENFALREQLEELTSRMEEHQVKILAVLDESKGAEASDEQIRSLIQAIFTEEDDSKSPELGSPTKLTSGSTSSSTDDTTSQASDDSGSNRPKRKTVEKNYCDNKKNKKWT